MAAYRTQRPKRQSSLERRIAERLVLANRPRERTSLAGIDWEHAARLYHA
jgi:hypothetical protein